MEKSSVEFEPPSDLADDLIRGVKDIAAFLGPSFSERSVYHLVEKQALPVFRLPGVNTVMARKSELRRVLSSQG